MVQWPGDLNDFRFLPGKMLSSSFLDPEDAEKPRPVGGELHNPRQERSTAEEAAENPLSGHVRKKSLDKRESMQHYCAKNL
jgi:hypothetical protein